MTDWLLDTILVTTLILAAGRYVSDGSGRSPLMLAVAFHLASNLGWLYFTPTVTALVSRAAPRSVNATMIGAASLSVFLGSTISGRLGSLYEVLPASQFWTLHAALVGLGGVVFLIIGLSFAAAFRTDAPATD